MNSLQYKNLGVVKTIKTLALCNADVKKNTALLALPGVFNEIWKNPFCLSENNE